MATQMKQTSERKAPHPQARRAFVYYTTFLLLGLSVSLYGPTLDGLAGQTGSTLSQISLIFVGSSSGVIVGSLLGGWLFDRQPGNSVLAIAFGILALSFLALPLVASRGLMVAIIFVIGMGAGAIDVGGNTLVMWLFGHDVGPFMNTLHLGFGIGALLAPILADRVVVWTGGIRWVYWILVVMILPVLLWLLRQPSPQPANREEVQAARRPARQYTVLIAITSMLFFVMVGTEVGFGGWVFSYGVATHIGTATIARLLNTVYWGGLTVGRLLSIPLALRLKPQTMLLADIIGALVSVALLLVLPTWPATVWIATFGLGFSLASMFPTTLNFIERRMPMSGGVTSIFLLGGNFGSMLLPWLMGQLFEPVGPHSLLLICEAALAVALLLFLTINGYAKRYVGERQVPA